MKNKNPKHCDFWNTCDDHICNYGATCVKTSYSLDEVRILLEKQKRRMCFSLGLSSRTFHYPSQYDDIVEWMMRCPLVI